jgi:hypothetical protein
MHSEFGETSTGYVVFFNVNGTTIVASITWNIFVNRWQIIETYWI